MTADTVLPPCMPPAKIVEAQGEENVSVYIAGINSDDEGIDFADVYIFPKKG